MTSFEKIARMGVMCIWVLLGIAGARAESGTESDPYLQWVGETREYQVTGLQLGNLSSYSWSSSTSNLTYTGNGLACTVKPKRFFGTTEYVKFNFTTVFGLVNSRTFYIACRENPVHISPSTLSLQINESSNVSYSHEYNNQYATAANANISYSSSNTNVATVSSSGVVKAVGQGTARIYVHSRLANDENAPYCTVTVTTPTVELPQTMTINIGDTQTITPTHSPGSGNTLKWTSSNPAVATVSSSGAVTGKKKGTARITATVNGYNASDYCDVTVTADPKSISFPLSNQTLTLGRTMTVMPTVLPAGAEYTLTWSSSNTAVATVTASGSIYGKKVGTTTITARVKGTNLSASFTLKVINYIQGDVNGDGNVNVSDVIELINVLLSGGTTSNAGADVNGDGNVNMVDITGLITILLNN